MDDVLFPINPALTADGAFRALRHLPGGEALKPCRRGEPEAPLGEVQFETGTQKFDLDVAVQLGIGGLGTDVAVGVQSHVIDLARYSTTFEPAEGGDPDLILATRWGAGLRIVIKVRSVGVKAQGSLWGLAAQAEQNSVHATYTLSAFGLSSPRLLTKLPAPGRFDMEVASQLHDIADWVGSEAFLGEDLIPVPFAIRAPHWLFQPALDGAASVAFGMRAIQKGRPFAEAVQEAKESPALNPLKVRSVYQHLGVQSEPDQNARRRAGEWLR